ncbi:kelch-like protein [Actinomadura rubrisoli]|uniref:Kelch-like protein n=2 Tax=Actinomadura rubrisoli TaxID=2530368 RepID=A0A4R5BYD5_9ACTN|nr:kelch-like protein [Actinomadura rubrisoli]
MTRAIPVAADTWAPAPDYTAPVSWYGRHDGAVLLKDGKSLLVAGGADAASSAVKHAAVYDTGTKTWAAPVPLGTARQLHAVTVLPSGKVLVTGGTGGPTGPALATAELYDPVAKSWTPTKHPMATARWGHSAVLLSDGTVLVSGGSTVPSGQTVRALRSAEVFHPGDETWTAAPDMTDARSGHAAVALRDGKKVLVCGGGAPVGTAADPALAFCEVYDTDSKTWAPTGTMRRPRRAHQATALSATRVLVTGGSAPGALDDGGFDPRSQRTAEVYDVESGTWTDAAPMPAGRAFHRAVAVGAGKVLVIGGADRPEDEAGYRGTLLYDNGTWTTVAGLVRGRWAFAAVAVGAAAHVIGGVTASGLAAADPAVVELTKTMERYGSGS